MPIKPTKKATASPKTTRKAAPKTTRKAAPKTTRKAAPKKKVNQDIEATSSNKGKAPLEDYQASSDTVPFDIVPEDVDVESIRKYS